jgi:hypothetical protein
MTETERQAFVLHTEGRPTAEIEARTELSAAQIAAAVDLARVHARLNLRAAATPEPAAPPAPPQRPRRPGRPGLTPPHDLVEKNRVLTALVATLREQLAKCEAELAKFRTAGPAPAPEPEPQGLAEPAANPPLPAPPSPTPPPVAAAASEAVIRRWAITEGWTVPKHGLSGAIVLAYQSAHRGDQ